MEVDDDDICVRLFEFLEKIHNAEHLPQYFVPTFKNNEILVWAEFNIKIRKNLCVLLQGLDAFKFKSIFMWFY